MTTVRHSSNGVAKGLRLAGLLCAPLVLATFANSATAQDSQDLARLVAAQAKTIEALQGKVQRLEDIEAIKKLERAYGYYVDKNLWHQVGDLFADDATLEIAQRGVFVGRKAIEKMFIGFGSDGIGLNHGEMFNHTQVAGVVDVAPDGKTAQGRWRADAIVVNAPRGSQMLTSGIYENDYVKQDGVWKFSKLKYWTQYYTPYKEGWTGKQMICINGDGSGMSPGASRPSTDHAGVFPDIFYPPFHYPNPVTGKDVDVSKLNAEAVAQNVWPQGCRPADEAN